MTSVTEQNIDLAAAPAAQAQGQRAFFTPLEAFRGIAALSVAWFHSAFQNLDKPLLIKPGNIYVDFFFVLSGFVLMHAYMKRIERGMGFYEFAALRLARLWPLHFFMLMVWVMYNGVQVFAYEAYGFGDGGKDHNTLLTFFYNVFLIHSLGVVDHLTWNYPSWSISVEYYSYLVFFVLIVLFMKARYTACAVTAGLAFAALFAISHVRGSPSILASHDFGIVRCIAGIFSGAAVYGLYLRYPVRLGTAALTAAELAAVAAAVYFIAQSVDDKWMQFGAMICFMVLIYVFSNGTGLLSRILSLAPFRFLGTVSYSVYMVHAIILGIGGFAAKKLLGLARTEIEDGRFGLNTEYALAINLTLLAVTVAVSYVTYRMVERPGQTWMKRLLLPQRKG